MRQRDLVKLLKQGLMNSAGWENDEISQDRVSALNYYHRRERGDEVTGRSTTVSGDVSASVEANLAQSLDAFSTDNIVEFDALDEQDEPQAQFETDVVTHYVMKTQNGFLQLAVAIKEALLLRNGFIKVWVDVFTQKRTRTFDSVAPEAVEALLAKHQAELISYDRSKRVLKLRVVRTHKKFRAEAVEWVYYPKDWDSFDLQECPFVAQRHIDSRSELVRMGISKEKVDGLRAMPSDTRDSVGKARNVRGASPAPASNANTADRSMDLIEWFEAYVLIDVDGDGIAERRCLKFTYDDGKVLEDEACYLVPYAPGTALLNPHRLTGISDYDKLRHTQDEHTGLKRALYDNVNTVTKNRVAYFDDCANADDVGDGRPNGGIRVKRKPGITDVRQAVAPFAVPDNSANILANIEAIKRERSELGGAALDLQTGAMQIGGDRMGSQGLDRAYSVMEQLAAMKTKIIAATLIRSTFLLAHATLREYFTEAVSIKREGRWETATPSEWKPRDRITVKIGMSPGERARMAQALRQMLNDQVQLAGQGMDEVLVNSERFYRLLMAWARVVDIRNPEQFWLDPQSDESKKALELKTKAAEDGAQKRENLMERAIGKGEAEVALKKYTHDSELQYKYWEGVNRSEIAEAQIVGSATTELLKVREQGRREATKPAAPKKKPTKRASAKGRR